jgi:hypothetical protein
MPHLEHGVEYRVDALHVNRGYEHELRFEITTGGVLVSKQSTPWTEEIDVFELRFYEDLFMAEVNDHAKHHHPKIDWLFNLYRMIAEKLVKAYVEEIDRQLDTVKFDSEKPRLVLKSYLVKRLLDADKVALEVSRLGLSVVEQLRDRRLAVGSVEMEAGKAVVAEVESTSRAKAKEPTATIELGHAVVDDTTPEEPAGGFERWNPSSWLS